MMVGSWAALAGEPVLRLGTLRRPGMADRTLLQAGLDALQRGEFAALELEGGRTYDLGDLYPPEFGLRLRGLRGAVIDGNGATLTCNTAASGKTQMMLIQNCTDLQIRDLAGYDRGTDLRQTWRGADFIHCDATAGPTTNLMLRNIAVRNAVSLFTCSGVGKEARSGPFRFRGLVARNCYYGLSFQENGDGVSAELAAFDCRRAYFAYGIEAHSISLRVRHRRLAPGADACVLIKRYLRDTSAINIDADFAGTLGWHNFFKLEQHGPDGESGVIEAVNLALSISPTAANPYDTAALGISAYRADRLVRRSNDIWRGVHLSGCLGPVARAIRYYSEAASPTDMGISSDLAACR